MDNQINQVNQAPAQVNPVNAPSVYYLKCPYCGSNNLRILGKKGSLGASVGIGAAFGAIGVAVAGAINKDDYTYVSIKYKCETCKRTFEALPLMAQPDEILLQPCKVVFTRLSGFYGWAVSQTVWMNGVKIGTVKNGQTIEFFTFTKYNTVFVSDNMGVAFRGDYKFEAQSGGAVPVKAKCKFGWTRMKMRFYM